MSGYVITLPEQPKVGSVVEIVDGANEGCHFERMTATMWRELNRDGSWGRDVDWSWVWWSVCEDGGGGTAVRVVPPADVDSPGMVVDGDVLRDVIADAVPRYLVDAVAHQIAEAALDGAVRAGMTVLHGPSLTPRAHPPGERMNESSVNDDMERPA